MILSESSFMKAVYESTMGQPDFMVQVSDSFA